ncbi:uncharacterized protein ZBAI_04525 [Zygosaccharomyces bailii ISA1307]|nr:uncharacterized protein ZBAI_04525 [Zygosaccharomyces bailii ISA1307]
MAHISILEPPTRAREVATPHHMRIILGAMHVPGRAALFGVTGAPAEAFSRCVQWCEHIRSGTPSVARELLATEMLFNSRCSLVPNSALKSAPSYCSVNELSTSKRYGWATLGT